MADPFSIASGIAGFLSLAMEITKILVDYTANVKSAPSDVTKMLEEVDALVEVLEQLKDFLEDNSDTISETIKNGFQENSALSTALKICKTEIEKLRRVLHKFKVRRTDKAWLDKLQRLKWPFSKEECLEITQRLNRCSQTFTFSMTISNCKLLSETSAELRRHQKAMEDILSVAPELSTRISDLSTVLKLIGGSVEKVEERVEELHSMLNYQKTVGLLKILSPLEPLKRHQDVRAQRLQNTGTWLLQHELFTRWVDIYSNNLSTPQAIKLQDRILCCYGFPGVGKTVLSSLVIDHLIAQFSKSIGTGVGVTYMYSDYRDQEKQTAVNILGSILEQLLAALPDLPKEVAEKLEAAQKYRKSLGTSDMIDMLDLTFPQFKHIFICIDALDELEQRTWMEVLEILKKFMAAINIQLFLTGRPHIEPGLNKELELSIHNVVTISAHPEDIRLFVSRKLQQAEKTDPESLTQQLKEQILSATVERSQGMFLLPALQISMILEEPTISKRRKALETLPVGLEAAFKGTVHRIQSLPKSEASLGMKILMWIHLAYRPLTLQELNHAIAVEIGDKDFDQENIPSESKLLSCCLGLAVIDHETYTVRLVHYSLEEYFRQYSLQIFPLGHTAIAEICLTYLLFDSLSQEDTQDNAIQQLAARPQFLNYKAQSLEIERLAAKFPLLKYAAYFWGLYFCAQPVNSPRATELALKLLQRGNIHYHPAMWLLFEEGNEWWPDRPDQSGGQFFSGLHAAAYFGLDIFMQNNRIGQQNWDRRDEAGRTPLSYAAENGHLACVRLLLSDKGVEPDSRGIGLAYDPHTPLFYASHNGHEAVVRLLLEREDVEADFTTSDGRSPLSHAAEGGHVGVVALLLGRHDVNINSVDGYEETPLEYAVRGGHGAIVRMLIQREDIEINIKSSLLLLLATQAGHEAVVKALLEHPLVAADTQVDIQGLGSLSGRTPLSIACQEGFEAIVRILLDRNDVEPDGMDREGRTPLSWAAANGHERIVSILLDRTGVRADCEDCIRLDGPIGSKRYTGRRTPLSYAAEMGHEAVVRLLLVRGDVQADSKDENGRSPLSHAARRGKEAIVQILLARDDVDADRMDQFQKTPLSYAAEGGHASVLHLLLGRDDVHAG